MADFTQTISVGINCFGVAPSSKWLAWNWNEFRWGEGTVDLETRTVKFLAVGSITPSDALSQRSFSKAISVGTISLSEDLSSEGLRDGSGYLYVFPDRTSEGESRTYVTWTEGTDASSTWSAASAASTTWSDV